MQASDLLPIKQLPLPPPYQVSFLPSCVKADHGDNINMNMIGTYSVDSFYHRRSGWRYTRPAIPIHNF